MLPSHGIDYIFAKGQRLSCLLAMALWPHPTTFRGKPKRGLSRAEECRRAHSGQKGLRHAHPLRALEQNALT